ncbi:hypothetical protein [Alloactinosynnema sp. L-07]|uniref:hypothetical protein n=1 Tax=Alloactinosynnema sp. L-07 TaxID=1653480 RepID=UPI00065EF784|nr:hypothetical protein [Alloactinosynnema sp. L-07]CRK61573.1 hypothetical protein [Alloactinosynnema sp. L-07]
MAEHLTLDQHDLVTALVLLRNKISELVVRATTEGPSRCPWADLALILDTTATLCRREVLLNPRQAGTFGATPPMPSATDHDLEA